MTDSAKGGRSGSSGAVREGAGVTREGPTLWTRRDWLTRASWTMVLGGAAVTMGSWVRLLFPRVRYDPPTTVVLDRPEAIPAGVSERWKRSHQLIVVRTERGFYALRAVCSHLGCVPDWRPARRRFKCPCHGSSFTVTGHNEAGPAPRPLERVKLTVDGRGRLIADTAVRYRRERGEWTRPGAFLPYRPGKTS